MLSQHYSGLLLSTIKPLIKHKQGTHDEADLLILSLKESDLSVSNLSFGGVCLDHLSGHPLCREEAHPVPHCWTKALKGIM